MRSAKTVRRGNGGSRASRYRWGAIETQCSSRCLNPTKRWRGYSPSPASVDLRLMFPRFSLGTRPPAPYELEAAFIKIAFPPLTFLLSFESTASQLQLQEALSNVGPVFRLPVKGTYRTNQNAFRRV